MPKTSRNFDYVLALVFAASIILPTFLIDRANTAPLMVSFVLAFGSYLFLWSSTNINLQWTLGILTRIGLFLTLPILSDDIFRFLWDGFLLKNGIHPFAELPSYYLDKNVDGLSEALYVKLNSQNYFTVYPPINQGLFWLAVTVSENWLVATGVLRAMFLLADIGTMYYLQKILERSGKNTHLAFLYFLNPLVILEGVGNVHFEVLLVFFLAAAIYYYPTSKMKSGAAFGLAIGTKLLPLIVLPFLFLKDVMTRNWKLTVITGLVCITSLLPMLNNSFINGMQNSLALYVQNFEFNGSVFRIAREIGILVQGYNPIKTIGPIFSLISFLGIIAYSVFAFRKKYDLPKTMLFVWSIYLLLASTVHPWYILPLILLGILSGQTFPIVWSLVIFVTYAGYSDSGHDLHWIWILLEYLFVLLAFIYNNRLKSWLTIS